MDKNAIKKYAVWARRELIARVSQKALQYGITEDEIVDAMADSINGKVLSMNEKRQRKALIDQIKVEKKSYEQVMEEVAYTWFNRFIALRFMEVNNYLPSHIRVFTDEDNNFKPQIIAEAIHLDLEGLDMDKVYAYKNAEQTEALYKYLLIVQCNALNSILPAMFQKIADYTELLLPDNLLREGSVIEQMISMIKEEDWKNAVQIIGWLYQYYNSEKKDEVFALLKKNVKITKENIPAATQLFTPDWIVRYMVENSLGRLWLEGHPNNNLKSEWKYYLDEAEQETDVQIKLDEIRKEYAGITPEQIKCIDPCCGSGHILTYMFDVLIQIYEVYGFTTREAVASIVENNIYGLDIDDRAAQLAYFSVMMKARQYDRRFFSRCIQPHVYAIAESNHIDGYTVEYFCNGDAKLTQAMNTIIVELNDAKEYGSILNITKQDWSAIYARFVEIIDDININIEREVALKELVPLVQCAEVLAQKYDAVITNPPYMGNGSMSSKLSDFVKMNYPDTKSDMSTVCMEKTLSMCRDYGYMAMINIPVWMFIQAYKKLREMIVEENTIVNMAHCGRGIFGSDFGTTAFVIRNHKYKDYLGTYLRLFENQNAVDFIETKETWFHERKGFCLANQDYFSIIPSCPIAYWLSEEMFNAFKNFKPLKHYVIPASGSSTGDNDTFLRMWSEVSTEKLGLYLSEDYDGMSMKWIPCNKGGAYRRWYGNFDYVMDWENNGYGIRNNRDERGKLKSRPLNLDKNFFPGLTWTKVGAGAFSLRYFPAGFICESIGAALYKKDCDLIPILGFLNTKIADKMMAVINPTMGCQPGDLAVIPTFIPTDKTSIINELTRTCVELSKEDWDSFETSWDFETHPLIAMSRKHNLLSADSNISIKQCFELWEQECFQRFENMKNCEEKLNEIFIDAYDLSAELDAFVDDKSITVRLANLQREIKSLISYAVGCMFGRYSLDVDGLVYAGGKWDNSRYTTFPVNVDCIIPICDDEYFTDDIVGRFVRFVEVVFGTKSLDTNLRFVADVLGGTGNAKDIIRKYFTDDFFKDHCATYSGTVGKRPIYWLFDSGKKNGFKSLIYMHRYQPDTIARMRTDYVHEQQARYRTVIADLEHRIVSATTSERVKLNKQLIKLQAQAVEIREYEEKIHHLADQMIQIDLDDGVKVNYAKFQDVLAKIK